MAQSTTEEGKREKSKRPESPAEASYATKEEMGGAVHSDFQKEISP